jgi:hypothetical protein
MLIIATLDAIDPIEIGHLDIFAITKRRLNGLFRVGFARSGMAAGRQHRDHGGAQDGLRAFCAKGNFHHSGM